MFQKLELASLLHPALGRPALFCSLAQRGKKGLNIASSHKADRSHAQDTSACGLVREGRRGRGPVPVRREREAKQGQWQNWGEG